MKDPASLSTHGRLKFLLKDSTIYGGASAIGKGFALISFPILARHFSQADYGIVDYYLVLGGFLSTFFIFGQDSAVARFYYEKDEKEYRKEIISNSLLIQIVIFSVVGPILWFNIAYLLPYIGFTNTEYLYLKIVFCNVPLLLLINFSTNLLKWTFCRWQFLFMSLGLALMQMCGLIFSVYYLNAEIQTILLAVLLVNFFFASIGIIFIRGWIVIPKNFNLWRPLLIFGIPFCIIGVLNAISPLLERTVTNNWLGSEQLGVYAIAAKIASVISVLISAFQTAWGPFSLSIFKEENAIRSYNIVLVLFTWVMNIIVLSLLLIAAPLISILVGQKYIASATLVFPVAFALIIQAIGWITEVGVGFSKRTHLNLLPFIFSLIISFITMVVLVPIVGILGVCLGVLLGNIVRTVIITYFAQKAYPLAWSFSTPIKISLIAFASWSVSEYFRNYVGLVYSQIVVFFGLLIIIYIGIQYLRNQISFGRLLQMLKFK